MIWYYNIVAGTKSGDSVERYRSGHNEAVLKTVWGKPHMGSNPILSATLRGNSEGDDNLTSKFTLAFGGLPKW